MNASNSLADALRLRESDEGPANSPWLGDVMRLVGDNLAHDGDHSGKCGGDLSSGDGFLACGSARLALQVALDAVQLAQQVLAVHGSLHSSVAGPSEATASPDFNPQGSPYGTRSRGVCA